MIRRIYIRSLLVLAMLLHGMIASALPHQYYQFNNLKGMTQKLCVRSMAQTEDGMMWFGTEDGLYSYNGYHLRRHDLNGISAGPFNYMAAVGDSILIGGERGLLSFSLHNLHVPSVATRPGRDGEGYRVGSRPLVGSYRGCHLPRRQTNGLEFGNHLLDRLRRHLLIYRYA